MNKKISLFQLVGLICMGSLSLARPFEGESDLCFQHDYVFLQPAHDATHGELNGYCCVESVFESGKCQHEVFEAGCQQDSSNKTISCCYNHAHKQVCLYEKEFVADSCATAANNCGANETCINLYEDGQIQCECNAGFVIINGICSMDICGQGLDRCDDQTSECVNLVGNDYRCQCFEGYVTAPGSDGLVCDPITTTAAVTTPAADTTLAADTTPAADTTTEQTTANDVGIIDTTTTA